MPGQESNAVEPVDIAGKRYEPEKTVGGLPNLVHPRRQRPVLRSPGRMYVLGDVLVRIERVEGAGQQQDRGNARTQRGRIRAEGRVQAKQKPSRN